MIAPKAKGSFRGVPFYTHEDTTKVGRRQPTYSIPFQDAGALGVDLGRAPQRYTLSIFLIDSDGDLTDQIKAFIDALETPGPGLLVHPNPAIGRKNVLVGDDIDIGTRTDEGRKVAISFKAIEAAEAPQAGPSLDSASSLLSKVKSARGAAGASFENPLTGLQKATSDFVKAAHLDVLDDVINDLAAVNGAINSVLSIPGAFAEQLDAISRQAADLLNSPRKLFNAIDDAMTLAANAITRIVGKDGTEQEVLAVSTSPLNRARGSRGSLFGSIGPMSLLGSKSPTIPDTDTPERREQRAGQKALQRHSRASGLLALASAAPAMRFAGSKDAIAVRDALAKALIDLSDSTPDLDTAFSDALRDAAAALITHLTLVAGSAADVTRYTPPDTLPIEVIAHTLYGDATRSDEIAERNSQITHPGVVPGKVAIEVLTQ